jgi:GntR family transcriptional regulator / MocR family aminotransferase
MVTPPRWTEALRIEEAPTSGPSILEQFSLSRFIETGGYDRHLRAMRRRYRARRDRFAAAVGRHLPGFHLSGAAAGLHVLLGLPAGLEGRAVAAAARARGVRTVDLAACRCQDPDGAGPAGASCQTTEGLVLGYGNLDDRDVEEAVAELARAIREVQSTRARHRPTHPRE